jgi:S1-C subfamily serine protease
VLISELAQLKPGQTVQVKVLHNDGRRETIDVTLGQLQS